MRAVLLTAFAIIVSATPVWASGYDDFAQGITANLRDDPNGAIAAFSSALAAPDLDPAYRPTALRGRARAYFTLGKCTLAKTDVNSAAALLPLDPPALLLRASIEVCFRDGVGAQKDFDTALGPDSDITLSWSFGRLLWRAGMFEEAYPNLTRSADLLEKKVWNPDAPYILLWYAVAADRIGRLDTVKLSERVDTIIQFPQLWPMALLKMYLGKLRPEEAQDALPPPNFKDYGGQKCAYDFYVGEWYVTHKNREAAQKAIASAIAECSGSFIEFNGVDAEAERLGISLRKEVTP